MKFNWGHGLILVIAISSLGFIWLVILSSREQVDLVTEEYYPKGLVYNNEIEKQKNTNALEEKIQVEVNAQTLELVFPEVDSVSANIKGKILFYCPSDKRGDKNYIIALNNYFRQSFPTNDLKPGRYEIIVDWQAAGVNYLQKETVFIDK